MQLPWRKRAEEMDEAIDLGETDVENTLRHAMHVQIEIAQERARAVESYSPAQDDLMSRDDWWSLLGDRFTLARLSESDAQTRRRILQMLAVGIAMIESMDRTENERARDGA